MQKQRVRGDEHKEDMRVRGQILRAKVIGFRELIMLLIQMGVVVPAVEERFRAIDSMNPETWRRLQPGVESPSTHLFALGLGSPGGGQNETKGEEAGGKLVGPEGVGSCGETQKDSGASHGENTNDQARILE